MAARADATKHLIENRMRKIKERQPTGLQGLPSCLVEGAEHVPRVGNTLGKRLLPLLLSMEDIVKERKEARHLGVWISV